MENSMDFDIFFLMKDFISPFHIGAVGLVLFIYVFMIIWEPVSKRKLNRRCNIIFYTLGLSMLIALLIEWIILGLEITLWYHKLFLYGPGFLLFCYMWVGSIAFFVNFIRGWHPINKEMLKNN
jgi:hypothetical protein